MERPVLVVFQGGAPPLSPLERFVLDAQSSAALDLLALAAKSGHFSRLVLVSEQADLLTGARSAVSGGDTPLEIESSAGPFHFGAELRRVCVAHGIERVVYAGGGSLPLASARDLHDLAVAAGSAAPCVVSNNLYSADTLAFWPTSALDDIELPETDNDLAWLLHFRAGLPFSSLTRTIATQFDIDTPTDLAILCLYTQGDAGLVGHRLQAVLERVPAEMPELIDALERVYGVMSTRRSELIVCGRVSSWVWRRLEANLPCQTRIFSEERGMRASGREERGEVRSLLGFYISAVGVDGLFRAFEQAGTGALIDSRVLFAHRRLQVSRPDRFASDAYFPSEISDPWVREFTEAAMQSSVPVVLGGHSLVSGGAWALSERVYRGGSGSGG